MRTSTFSSLPNKFLTALVIIAMVIIAMPVAPAFAATTITVTTTADEYDFPANGTCSLREAIANANNNATTRLDCPAGTGADTIVLTSGSTYTLADAGGLGDLDISDAAGLTIQANGSTAAIIDGGVQTDHVLDTTAASGNLTLDKITVMNGNTTGTGGGINFGSDTGALTLTNSTVQNNTASGTAGCGAGIYNNTAATITLNDSTVRNNTCSDPTLTADGGGLFKGTGGTLIINNSTFNNNRTPDNGGGAQINIAAGTASIANSTFANNTAGTKGGGIQVNSGTVTVEFSTFSGNIANGSGFNTGVAIQANGGSVSIVHSILANSTTNSKAGKDCDQSSTGTISLTDSLAENKGDCGGIVVSNLDPGLGALADNTGPTQTMAITNSSPAFNAASSCDSKGTDQRGITRPQFGICDLGAFELENTGSPAVLSIVRADANDTAASSVNFTVTFSEIVTGVDTSDFTLTTTGVSGAAVGVVSGSGDTYTVPVNTGSGNGTIRLDLIDDDSIRDGSNNRLGGIGVGNGNFNGGETYNIIKTASFTDVPTDYWAWLSIERLYNARITGGCSASPLMYCPDNSVTRAEIAVFLERGMNGSSFIPPSATGSVFTDVPASYWAAAWIEQLASDGITGGCGIGVYCPDNPVTRAQMAVFLLRAKHGSSYTPPAPAGAFGDVPTSYWAAAWIEQLAVEGITTGCGGGNYCPEDAVTRAQMAVFLIRTFNLP